jgi:hypothetical protein
MLKHIECRHPGIDAELLRQIAENFANLTFLGQNIEFIELDRTGVGILQRGDRTHQGAFACSVGTKQPEHMVPDRECEIFQRFYAIWIGLGQTCDFE